MNCKEDSNENLSFIKCREFFGIVEVLQASLVGLCFLYLEVLS